MRDKNNDSLQAGENSKPIIIKRIFTHDDDNTVCSKIHKFYNKRGMPFFSCRCGHGGYVHVQFRVKVEEPYYMHKTTRGEATFTPLGVDHWIDEDYHEGTFKSLHDVKIYERGEKEMVDIWGNPDVLLIDEAEEASP